MSRVLPKFALAITMTVAMAAFGYAQEPFKENPIREGAWVYPTEKIAPATVEAFCQSGFSMHFADGGFFTLLNQPAGRMKKKLSVDTNGTCSFDVQKQTAICSGVETDNNRRFPLREESKFERDGDYIKLTTNFIDRETKQPVMFVTYPVRCPDKVVREILSKAIPPK